ncbi:MAG: LysR family transcriptional regulator [Acidobacteria bacterium]|nr:LysR family transcriptional regulator [Acidobacteriota bacterium]
MELSELEVFQVVAAEHSFSRAATRLHRTQPAVSQAIRRLERELGERLFDRSSKTGRLTEAGTILLGYAERLTRLKTEAEQAVRELQELRHGRVTIGVNEAAVHILLPIVEQFRKAHPSAQVEMRRVHSRQIPGDVLNRSLDFGFVTFEPAERGLLSVRLGVDELVMLAHPQHPLARRRQVTMEEFGRQTVIAHNDYSPRRERVLRLFEEQHAPINIQISLASLDGIKRAVEMGLGVALLPRRCALSEIARKQLVAVRVPKLGMPRDLRLVYRGTGEVSHVAAAFLAAAEAHSVKP